MIDNCTLIRKAEVTSLLNISKSTLYSRINEGLLPPGISMGGRAIGYVKEEYQTVIAAMIAGYTKQELKHLVQELVEARVELLLSKGVNS